MITSVCRQILHKALWTPPCSYHQYRRGETTWKMSCNKKSIFRIKLLIVRSVSWCSGKGQWRWNKQLMKEAKTSVSIRKILRQREWGSPENSCNSSVCRGPLTAFVPENRLLQCFETLPSKKSRPRETKHAHLISSRSLGTSSSRGSKGTSLCTTSHQLQLAGGQGICNEGRDRHIQAWVWCLSTDLTSVHANIHLQALRF